MGLIAHKVKVPLYVSRTQYHLPRRMKGIHEWSRILREHVGFVRQSPFLYP